MGLQIVRPNQATKQQKEFSTQVEKLTIEKNRDYACIVTGRNLEPIGTYAGKQWICW